MLSIALILVSRKKLPT